MTRSSSPTRLSVRSCLWKACLSGDVDVALPTRFIPYSNGLAPVALGQPILATGAHRSAVLRHLSCGGGCARHAA